jgi:heme exporter protein A
MTRMDAIELTQISIDYGARRVMANLTVRLNRGNVMVVTGQNGSGKSSLLRVVCGLQRPSAGQVRFIAGDQAVAPAEARQQIGWMAPDLMLYRELTGLENLRFFADVRGLAIPDAELNALLERVGLHGRGADVVATYSSGMTHRLRYAYALLHRPTVLLLDEPSVMLDQRGHELLEAVVAQQRTIGLTIIATNDPREQRFADVLIRLEGSA